MARPAQRSPDPDAQSKGEFGVRFRRAGPRHAGYGDDSNITNPEVFMRRIVYWSAAAATAALTLAACNDDASIAPVEAAAHAATADYEMTVIDETLGGSFNVPAAINSSGWLAGYANNAGNLTRQAVVWRDGRIDTLGTLGGPNSAVVWTGLSESGMIVGIAETEELDPSGESWSCTPFFATQVPTGHVCRGFYWENGTAHGLPTFGGTHGYAADVNSRGQIVGWAENLVEDPTCNPSGTQRLQFRAALWEPRRGTMRELRPWRGDSTSAATAINERGQVVGISGDCDVAVGSFSAKRGLLWEADGSMVEIGGLGGEAWHTPTDINSRGDVVGFSNPAGVPGNTFQPKAFIWTRTGGIDSLPTLDGHVLAQAYAINTRGQIVGRSCGAEGCRAVLWQNGGVTNLNDLRPAGFEHTMTAARDITEEGVITGNLVEAGTGRNLPFVAQPVE
jgi:probable HAF family extracellular repeat protein